MPVHEAWMQPPVNAVPGWWRLTSGLVFLLVTAASKLWIGLFNSTKVHDLQRLYDVIEKRPKERPLITIANHNSCFDDPLLACMLKWRHVFDRDNLRWLLGAKNVCFKKHSHSLFFSLGKVLPVVRGDGVYQHSMNYCVDALLDRGHWVHLYPEGKINMDKKFMRLKWGVGRLVADSKTVPLVLPFWHIGMDDILPNYKPYIPQVGKTITVSFGEPLDFTEDLRRLQNMNKSSEEIRKHITDKIEEEFLKLKNLTEKRHSSQCSDSESASFGISRE